MDTNLQAEMATDTVQLAMLIREGLSFLEQAGKAEPGSYVSIYREEGRELQGPTEEVYLKEALRCFREAVEVAPDEPWLWFQIGWWSFTSRFGSRDIEAARTALEKVLELDPDNAPAHLALASLHLGHGPYPFDKEYADSERNYALALEHAFKQVGQNESGDDLPIHLAKWQEYNARTMEADWNLLPGQHLRAALKNGAPYEAMLATAQMEGVKLRLDYYPTDTACQVLLDRLEELAEILPEEEKASYYLSAGLGLQESGWNADATRLFQEATEWEASSPDYACPAFVYLAIQQVFEEPPEFMAACQALERAYVHLMNMADPSDRFWEWLYGLEELTDKWDAGENWIDLICLHDLALDLRPFGNKLPELVTEGELAALAEAAARLVLQQGDLALAEHYLMKARSFDPNRVGVARRLAELYMDRQQWTEALAEQRRVVQLDSSDTAARRLVNVLECATNTALDRQTMDQILSQIVEIRAGQELILDELVLQRDLIQQVADLQRRVQAHLKHRGGDERAYSDLIEQLHSLVQEGSRIQPAAWIQTQHRLLAELSEKLYVGLHRNSLHFLVTAEVFYHASGDVADRIDAALIAVEYAKVVENELRSRFLPELGRLLDDQSYRGRLYGQREIRKRGNERWQAVLADLSLGATARLLEKAAAGSDNEIVMKYVADLGFDLRWLGELARDLLQVVENYRNGAAHTFALGRDNLEDFRYLLFRGGLIARLVRLGQRAEFGLVS